mmetsp:Transcript_46587/g.110780  ORF Transcript_46587/g.110780 Transcript_46587/m.110780 type:complete len:297 (+) Transcript_46587:412-1302(+)
MSSSGIFNIGLHARSHRAELISSACNSHEQWTNELAGRSQRKEQGVLHRDPILLNHEEEGPLFHHESKGRPSTHTTGQRHIAQSVDDMAVAGIRQILLKNLVHLARQLDLCGALGRHAGTASAVGCEGSDSVHVRLHWSPNYIRRFVTCSLDVIGQFQGLHTAVQHVCQPGEEPLALFPSLLCCASLRVRGLRLAGARSVCAFNASCQLVELLLHHQKWQMHFSVFGHSSSFSNALHDRPHGENSVTQTAYSFSQLIHVRCRLRHSIEGGIGFLQASTQGFAHDYSTQLRRVYAQL